MYETCACVTNLHPIFVPQIKFSEIALVTLLQYQFSLSVGYMLKMHRLWQLVCRKHLSDLNFEVKTALFMAYYCQFLL